MTRWTKKDAVKVVEVANNLLPVFNKWSKKKKLFVGMSKSDVSSYCMNRDMAFMLWAGGDDNAASASKTLNAIDILLKKRNGNQVSKDFASAISAKLSSDDRGFLQNFGWNNIKKFAPKK